MPIDLNTNRGRRPKFTREPKRRGWPLPPEHQQGYGEREHGFTLADIDLMLFEHERRASILRTQGRAQKSEI